MADVLYNMNQYLPLKYLNTFYLIMLAYCVYFVVTDSDFEIKKLAVEQAFRDELLNIVVSSSH